MKKSFVVIVLLVLTGTALPGPGSKTKAAVILSTHSLEGSALP